MAHMSSVQNPVLSLFRFTPAVSSRVGETITRPHSVSKDNHVVQLGQRRSNFLDVNEAGPPECSVDACHFTWGCLEVEAPLVGLEG